MFSKKPTAPAPPPHPGVPQFSYEKRRIILAVGAVVLIGAALFFVVTNIRQNPDNVKEADLTVWGVISNEEFENIADSYKKIRGNNKVTYTQFDEQTYQERLLNALAAGKGPDIFMIHNRWLPREKDKLIPADPAQFDIVALRDSFPRVVEQDFTDENGVIYALPLSIDTLAMVYNADFFDEALIVRPPRTWEGFRDAVRKLRRMNDQGQITRAGAAIGGSTMNIKNAVDIVNLLMLQNGVKIIDKATRGVNLGGGADSGADAGTAALNFYLQFANAGSPYYTWNDAQPDSFQAAAEGKAAIVFAYARDLAEIRKDTPFVPLRAAQMPQTDVEEVPINYADYWGFAVSKQTNEQTASWDFILNTAANVEAMRSYRDFSRRPPALLDLISESQNDAELGVFVKQALTARSWYQPDERAVREIFSRAIQRVLRGQITVPAALGEIDQELEALVR